MDIKQIAILSFYKKYFMFILFTIIAVVFKDIFNYLSWIDGMANTTIISALLVYSSLFILVFIAFKTYQYNNIPAVLIVFLNLWLLWNIFNLIRGIFLANNYWDWKFLFLSSIGFTFITLVYYVGNNIVFARSVLKFYLKWVFLFGFILIPLALVTNIELYSRVMIPVSFFILFLPYLRPKWKYLIIIVAITSIIVVIGFRSNILKIVFSLMILILFYYRMFKRQIWFRIAHFILFVSPIILFALGIKGVFNPFANLSSNQEYVIITSQGNEENFAVDTRTFLYIEVLSDMNNVSDWLIGKSACGSYHTEFFNDTGGAINDRRYRSEVNILNILLYNGIFGVISYFLVLYVVSYYAINKSNNTLSKMLGLAIAFRWTFSFVEEFTTYNINFFFFWLIMGLVSSTTFRALNDKQIKNYLKFS